MGPIALVMSVGSAAGIYWVLAAILNWSALLALIAAAVGALVTCSTVLNAPPTTDFDFPLMVLHYGLYNISFAIMFAHFYILWDSFIDAFSPYLDPALDTSVLFKQLYAFILYMNIFIFLAYSVFPVVHVATYMSRTKECYEVGELAYIAASLTAKVGLILIVLFGIVGRPD